MGFRVTHLYGLTESYGPATLCAWQDAWAALAADGARAADGAPGRCRCRRSPHCRSAIPRPVQPVPRDGATIGEVMLRGNTIMKGYLRNDKATTRRVPPRLVSLGRPRRVAPRQLHRGQGSQQGHHHHGRRERELARSGGVPVSPPARDGGGGRRAARREVGRDALRVRHAEARRAATGERRSHRVVPRAHRALQGARRRSCSGRCPRPRPARSRSSCCATRRKDAAEDAHVRADLLAGKVALVTGASSGLGRHFAQLLARHGADVVVAARAGPMRSRGRRRDRRDADARRTSFRSTCAMRRAWTRAAIGASRRRPASTSS